MTRLTPASRSGGRPTSWPAGTSARCWRPRVRGSSFGELIDLDPPDDPVAADAESEAAVALLLAAADADARAGELENGAGLPCVRREAGAGLPAEYTARRERWRRRLDPGAAVSPAGARIDPGLVSAEAAISDLDHRIGRLRDLEARTGGQMKRDLSHLDEGMRQLRALSRETGVLGERERIRG